MQNLRDALRNAGVSQADADKVVEQQAQQQEITGKVSAVITPWGEGRW